MCIHSVCGNVFEIMVNIFVKLLIISNEFKFPLPLEINLSKKKQKTTLIDITGKSNHCDDAQNECVCIA